MKVISCIKPRHSHVRHVTVNNTPYAFARDSDGEFSCEVDNPTDLGVFGRSRHFRVAGKSTLANPNAAATSGTPTASTSTDDGTGTSPPHIDPLVDTEALTLLEGTVADIGRHIGGVSSLDVLRRAIEIEQAPDGKQRKGVDTMLRQALAAAEQAGVTLS